MDITRRCDYAFRILRKAYENAGSVIAVSEIAKQENIPYSFARSIQHDLVHAGFLETVRGVRGGLKLSCDPQTTTLYQLICALEGPVFLSACSKDPSLCENSDCCAYHKLWVGADQLLEAYFSSITLEGLLTQAEKHPVIKEARNFTFSSLSPQASNA